MKVSVRLVRSSQNKTDSETRLSRVSSGLSSDSWGRPQYSFNDMKATGLSRSKNFRVGEFTVISRGEFWIGTWKPWKLRTCCSSLLNLEGYDALHYENFIFYIITSSIYDIKSDARKDTPAKYTKYSQVYRKFIMKLKPISYLRQRVGRLRIFGWAIFPGVWAFAHPIYMLDLSLAQWLFVDTLRFHTRFHFS